jgi:undecaprenyl-diphosphatase
VSFLEAIVLGITQGLTEFLPISSTAHLRIVPAFAGWEDPGAAFTAVTQLGTMAAVLLYFRADLARIGRAWLRSLRDPAARRELDARLGWYILLGTIPIGIFGLAFKDQIETGARDLYLIGIALIVLGLVLLAAERVASHDRPLEEITTRDGIVIGFAQALALIPGVSRSGATLTAGLFMGLDRTSAARFSFLLSIPAVVLSGVLEFGSILKGSERWRSRRCSPSWSATRRLPSCCASWRATRRSCSWSTGWRSGRSSWCWRAPARSSNSLRFVELAWKFGVIALVALALVVLPGGGSALDVVLTALTILFFAAIALLVARLYRQYRLDIESLDPNIRLALYGSLAIAVLTFTGTDRLFNAGGAGVLLWFGLLVLASYGLFWAWTRYRRYE